MGALMRKTVFLSSTGKDLAPGAPRSSKTCAATTGSGSTPWRNGARARARPLHLCRERVAESHIFVGVIGHYRGWEPDGDNGLRSITEMEYDWAMDGNKPRLMLVAPDSFAGAAPASDGDAKARQQAFRARLMSDETVGSALTATARSRPIRTDWRFESTLAARDPNNAEWQRDLSVSYDRVGDISAARGDRDGALKAYKDGLEIAKPLAARDPNNVVWQTDLVVSAWKLAEAGADG